MSVKIRPLSHWVANQIAAGEVIERPASVVKELLENALDAGASQIQVFLNFGGLNSIMVTDDGEGILEEDLPYAVMSHATSKINTLSDLAEIRTMGFRGEALASIASVSKLTIQSKPKAQAYAMQLSIHDDVMTVSPCARNDGTSIQVDDLFFNAPVRKRFLKSQKTEFLAVDKLVRRFALSAPDIGLSFYHNERIIFNLPKGRDADKQRLRVHKVLGKNFLEAALPLEHDCGILRLRGWITQKNYGRTQQDRIWVYVNQRMVNDKLLNHAIRQAYTGFLPEGRYPGCLLYIDIDPKEVDVNVHPTKHELRFHNARMVHDAIRSSLAELLSCSTESEKKIEPTSENEPRSARFSVLQIARHQPELTHSNWLKVSDHYAIVLREAEAYLLHIERLLHDRLIEHLSAQSLPLKARPLYLPVSVMVDQLTLIELEKKFELLAQLGITLSWGGERSLLIRSLPVDVPQLDIKSFIEVVLTAKSLGLSDLFELLAQHQDTDIFSNNEEKKQEWLAYIDSLSSDKQHKYIKLLTNSRCQMIFSDAS